MPSKLPPLAAAFISAVLLGACAPKADAPTTETSAPAADAAQPIETSLGDAMFADYLPWPEDGANVVTTPTGLQYIIVESGPETGTSPAPTDRVVVHYEGRIAASGAKFDSSYDRGEPARFPAGRLIRGWVEALGIMKPGDTWMLYIPTDLAYGQNPRPGGVIQPGDDLIFRVELQDVVPMPTANAAAWAAYTPWDSSREGVQKTQSGLEYIVLAPGKADARKPIITSGVAVHYEGRLAATGETFDTSFARGEPATFTVGGVIAGWTEMLQLMAPGEHVLVYIPAGLAYGAAGTPGGPIPPNADLIFEVVLLDVMDVR